MVCNLHIPTGTTYFRIFQNLEQKGISGEKTLPVSWLDEKLSLPLPRPRREPTTSRIPRLHTKQGVPHPTCSAIGRRPLTNHQNSIYQYISPRNGEGVSDGVSENGGGGGGGAERNITHLAKSYHCLIVVGYRTWRDRREEGINQENNQQQSPVHVSCRIFDQYMKQIHREI